MLLQLEVPHETVRHAIMLCRRHGVFTILDPHHARSDCRQAAVAQMFQVDLFTPNQTEAELILGMEQTHRVKKKRVEDPEQIAADLLAASSRGRWC